MRTFTRSKPMAALLALLLLAALFQPAGAGAASESDVTFVRVLLSTEDVQTLPIQVSGVYTLKEAQRSFSGGTLSVSASGNRVTVTHSEEGELYTGKQATVERASLRASAGALTLKTRAGTRDFLGHFTFTADDGVVRAVNRVPMTHYLYGVVAYEMSNDFPLEALRAQAVAAKNYALLNISSSGSYDLVDTADDQVYKGYEPAYQNVLHAVDSTATDVLYYEGKPLQCYYAASNGGWMILPGTRWSSKEFDGAYARGADAYDMKNPATPRETVFVPLDYSERAMGTRAFAFIDSRLSAAIGADGFLPEGFYFGKVQSVDSVVASGETGYDTDRNYTTVTLNATVRANLDPSLIPSPTPAWDPTPSPTPSHAPTPSPTPAVKTPAPTEAPLLPEGADAESWVSPSPTPEPELPTPTPEGEPTPSPTPEPDPTPSPTPGVETSRALPVSISFTFEQMEAAGLYPSERLKIFFAEKTNGGFNLLHARYGHGVGMSQRGAQQMANEGKTYREILSYYYPGATLETVGYVSPESVADPPAPTVALAASTGRVLGGGSPVNLRKKASTSSEKLESVPDGANLTLMGMQGSWYYVSTPAGNTGYISADYVQLTGENAIASGVINASAVNYRTGPGKDFDALGRLSRNTPVGVYGMEGEWYKIFAATTGKIGYVNKSYVTLTSAATDGTDVLPTNTPLPAGVTPVPIVISAASPTPSPTPIPTTQPGLLYSAEGRVSGENAHLYEGASTETRNLGKLTANARLGVFEKTGAWYRVRVLDGGAEGFVYAANVSLDGTRASRRTAATASGTINASGVLLREGPSTKYNRLEQLSRGASVKVLASEGSWLFVEVSSSKTQGYVFSKYVAMRPQVRDADPLGVVTARLNLRASPATGDGSRILLTMPEGAVVTVHSTANGWCHVTYDGTSGYCMASYLRLD